MSEASETVKRIQASLEPYVRPREQANYIRRIIALHLKSSADVPLSRPLALAGASDNDVPASSERGIHGEYLDALRKNVAARRQFDKVMQERPETPNYQHEPEPEETTSLLDEQLAILKLQKKRQKLSAVRKYLDQLVDQPAASPDYLNASSMFIDTMTRPAVPPEIMESLGAENSATSGPDLRVQAKQLERIVLRAKLLLNQEEKLLCEAKARSRGRPGIVSNRAKLQALQATRNELIGWIEKELSEAPPEDTSSGHGSPSRRKGDPAADQVTVTQGLAVIKDKYSRYLKLREELVSLTSARPEMLQKPSLKPGVPQPTTASDTMPAPINHLLIPYIEKLLTISTNQKALIGQKSYIKATLDRQTREACARLGHLAEESQLLPAYPMKESLRRRSGIAEELLITKSGTPDLSKRIKPWVFASDSAKIAGLESVTETIEGGQLALEASLEVLRELEALTGLSKAKQEDEIGDETAGDDDVWLATGEEKDVAVRKHTEKPRIPERKPGDAWSILHGNLGLLGQEDVA